MAVITTYKAIPDLPSAVTLNGTDVVEIVHNPGQTGAQSQQATLNQLASAIGGGSGGSALIISSPPEGVVTANAGQFAFDSVDEALWIKASGTNSTGWLQLI